MHARDHKSSTTTHSSQTRPTTTTKAAVASDDKVHKAHLVTPEVIQLCAYRKWENAGKPSGDGIPFWLEAEQELRHGK